MRNLEPLAHGRDNNFNLLRMLAASAVIVSHAYPLAGGPHEAPPLTSFMPFSLGAAAVKVFFALSGFLVLKSWERKPLLTDFAVARCLRIFPALAVVAVATAFLLGPIMTSTPLSVYFTSKDTLEYAPQVVGLYGRAHPLPGVFVGNPYGQYVNGSLWTLYYETLCYAGLACAGVIGLLGRGRFPLLLALYAGGYVLLRERLVFHADLTLYAILSFPFVLGMIAYRYRAKIPAHWAVLVVLSSVAAALLAVGVLAEEACTIAIAYGALWAGQIRSPFLLRYNRIGDYSYGVYIYGWPMEQTVLSLVHGIAPALLFVASIPLATVCGILSWYLIEKPALQQKRKAILFVDRLRGTVARRRLRTAAPG
jgi:peptidoglycan/LPS O-acetylase OafA/YrhL